MKLVVLSKNKNVLEQVSEVTKEQYDISLIEDIEELPSIRKFIFLIDINSVMDEAFNIASRLSLKEDYNLVYIGVTDLDIDSRATKFNFLLTSFKDLELKNNEIIKKYNEI